MEEREEGGSNRQTSAVLWYVKLATHIFHVVLHAILRKVSWGVH